MKPISPARPPVAPPSAGENVYAAAQRYRREGLHVIPLHGAPRGICTCSLGAACGKNAGKHPAIANWKEFQTRAPTHEEVTTWFRGRGNTRNLAVVLTAGMAVLDFDDAGLFMRAAHTKAFANATINVTPRPGYHVWVTERRPSKSGPVLAGELDVKAESSYIVAPPSSRNDVPYRQLKRGHLEVENAVEFARALLARVKPKRSAVPTAASTPTATTSGTAHEAGWIAEALEDLKPGNRNETFAKLAGRLHRDGHAPEDIISILEPHADGCGFSEAELGTVVRSVSRYPRASSSAPLVKATTTALISRPLSVMLEEASPEIVWAVGGIFPEASINILGGQPGGGKTWLLLDLSIELARGGLWLGKFQTKQGKVLHLDCEAGARLLRPRYLQMLRAKGIEKSEGLPLEIVDSQVIHVTDPVSLANLRELIGRLQPDLIVMDSLVRLHAADENSASEMAQVSAAIQGIVRDYSVTVVIADHVRKAPGIPGSLDLSLRGSTEKVAAADTVLSLRKDRNHLIVEHSKSRWDKPVPSFEVEIRDEEIAAGKATHVRWVGTLETLEEAGFGEEDQDLVLDHLNDLADWISRQELVANLRKKLGAKRVDDALAKLLRSGQVEREDRASITGKGGRAAHYRSATVAAAPASATPPEESSSSSPVEKETTTTTVDEGPTSETAPAKSARTEG